ncbi:MAG TPA: RcnB family protein [Candidatus Saccharimonadia bacterium]|nr:RcnB family protein [Candidatus Saccharimonadia bacterium]
MNKFLVTSASLVLAVVATAATAQDRRSRERDTGEVRVEESDKRDDPSHGAPRDGSYDASRRDGGGYRGDASRDGTRHDGNRYDSNRHDSNRYDANRYDANRHGDRRYDGRHDGNRYDRHERDGIWPGYRGDRYTGRGYDHRGGYRYGGGYRHYGRYRAPSRYAYPRGYYARSWSIGHRLPPAYYGPSYYIDYRPYGLAPPPYGYRWVRIDNDVVLVAIATGLIAEIIDDLYY